MDSEPAPVGPVLSPTSGPALYSGNWSVARVGALGRAVTAHDGTGGPELPAPDLPVPCRLPPPGESVPGAHASRASFNSAVACTSALWLSALSASPGSWALSAVAFLSLSLCWLYTISSALCEVLLVSLPSLGPPAPAPRPFLRLGPAFPGSPSVAFAHPRTPWLTFCRLRPPDPSRLAAFASPPSSTRTSTAGT